MQGSVNNMSETSSGHERSALWIMYDMSSAVGLNAVLWIHVVCDISCSINLQCDLKQKVECFLFDQVWADSSWRLTSFFYDVKVWIAETWVASSDLKRYLV